MSRARLLTASRARLAHLGVAAVTIGVVYSPAFDADAVRDLLRLLVVPGLGLTGSVLWYLRGRGRRVGPGSRRAGRS